MVKTLEDYKLPRVKKQVVRNSAGRVVGEISNGVLRKKMFASRHMLRDPRGWTWDAAILDAAERAGVLTSRITDKETGAVFTAPISAFRAYGIALDRGFGPQICLPIEHWQVSLPKRKASTKGAYNGGVYEPAR